MQVLFCIALPEFFCKSYINDTDVLCLIAPRAFTKVKEFMDNSLRRKKLINLGADTLADAILDLADYVHEIHDLVERLIATPKENELRFKNRLSLIKDSNRFINWRDAPRFAQELVLLLKDIKVGVNDPLSGIKLVVDFYEADAALFNMCDDSGGDLGDVYRDVAKDLFVEFAKQYSDKERIANIVLELNRIDDYGIRDSLINCAVEYLPEDVIRNMVATLQTWVINEEEKYNKFHCQILILSLASQLKDPKLFEETKIASFGELNVAAIIDIARVYLESGDVKTAFAWVEKAPRGESFYSHELDNLLKAIYQK